MHYDKYEQRRKLFKRGLRNAARKGNHMVIYRQGDFKLAFTKEIEAQLDQLRLQYMSEDTEAGKIQAWLDDHEDRKVCSVMLYEEVFGNYHTPQRHETDRICEIMNTSIVGWETGPTTRFPGYGTQRSWICTMPRCKREGTQMSDTELKDEFVSPSKEETEQIRLLFPEK